jgi:hypothetical protein
MEFRNVKTAIQDILENESSGRFRVVGRQVMSKTADEIRDNDRLVQVYFSDGQFPKSGRMSGPKTHDLTIDIDLSCSASAEGDLSVLDSDNATHQQKALALLQIREASEIADTLIDDLIEDVYQILMDARNIDLLLQVGTISGRWIDRIQKDTLLERGSLVVKTANMKYTCRVQEIVSGSIGNRPAIVKFNSDTPISADPDETQDTVEKTGIIIDVDNN